MANILIYKTKPTQSIDSVETDLTNNEVTQDFTESRQLLATVTASGGTVSLPSPTAFPSTTPFIELVSDEAVDLTFQDDTAATIDATTNIFLLSGNIKGYNFNLTNNSVEDANVSWKIWW